MKTKKPRQKQEVFILMGECPDCGNMHLDLASGPAYDIVDALCLSLRILQKCKIYNGRFAIKTPQGIGTKGTPVMHGWDFSKVAILRLGNKVVESDWIINCPRALCIKKMDAVPEGRMIVCCSPKGAMFSHNLMRMAYKMKFADMNDFLRTKLAPFRSGKKKTNWIWGEKS